MGILDPASPKSPGMKAVPAPAQSGRGQTFGTHEQPMAPSPGSTPVPTEAELRTDTARAPYLDASMGGVAGYRSEYPGVPNAGGQVGTPAMMAGHGGPMSAPGPAPDSGLLAGYQAPSAGVPAGGPAGASGPIPGPGPSVAARRIGPAVEGVTGDLRERARTTSYSEPELAFRMGGGAENGLPTGGPRGATEAH